MKEHFPNFDRYEIVSNGTNARVHDTQTDKSLVGPGGSPEMTPRDAHDLREEYRYS